MRDEDIHIGDTLRIRSYEDMKSEFGADEKGDILMGDGVSFIPEHMGYMCGKLFTVSNAEDDDGYGYEYRSLQRVEGYGDSHWCIKSWMLESYEDDTEWEVADDNEIALLFS